MKGETLIFVVALVIIGLLFVKSFAPKLEEYGASYIPIENSINNNLNDNNDNNDNNVNNVLEINNTNIQNNVDISSIKELTEKK